MVALLHDICSYDSISYILLRQRLLAPTAFCMPARAPTRLPTSLPPGYLPPESSALSRTASPRLLPTTPATTLAPRLFADDDRTKLHLQGNSLLAVEISVVM